MDKLIGQLQSMLENKIPIIPYVTVSSGKNNLLSSATFAVMLKFNNFLSDTDRLCTDEIDMITMDLKNNPDKDLKINET